MADVQRYLDGIEAQHQSAPRYMATVKALLEKLDDGHEVLKSMPEAFSLDQAVGNQLDILGMIAGIDRRYTLDALPGAAELLDDDSFREVIRTKIIQNQWDGRGQSFQEIWNTAFRYVVQASWYDNQDMTVDINIDGQIPQDLVRLIRNGFYIPRPAGVGMNIIVTDRDYIGTSEAVALAKAVGIETRGMQGIALGGGVEEVEIIVYEEGIGFTTATGTVAYGYIPEP